MATKILTAAAVERLKPGPQRREIPDGAARGLYLVIQPTGGKSWALRVRRPDGRPAKLTLGPADLSRRELDGQPVVGQPLTLAAARALAANLHRERARGIDIVAEHQADGRRQRAEHGRLAANAFAAAAREFIEVYRTRRHQQRPRDWRETARVLGYDYPRDGSEPKVIPGGLADRWHDKDARKIDAHDIWTVVDEARRVAIPGLAARNPGASEPRARATFATLSVLFNWLLRQRRIAANPCAGLFRPAAPAARDRVLTSDEIRWFWRACEFADAPREPQGPRPFAPALRLLLLTGCRLNEVAGMRAAELAPDAATWIIPSDRTKNHRAHLIPLPPLVRSLIKDAQPSSSPAGFVFSSTGRSPLQGWSKVKRRVDAAMLAAARAEFEAARRNPDEVEIPPWRIHDLRRTAVTHMAELGVQPHVIEAVVNHISGFKGGIAGIYNRSEYLAEKKIALERWAAHVQALFAGEMAAVVPLRAR